MAPPSRLVLLQVPENVEVALERGNGQRGWRSLEKAEKASQFLVEAWKNRVEMNRTSLETAGDCDCRASVRAMRRCQMDMRTFLETECHTTAKNWVAHCSCPEGWSNIEFKSDENLANEISG